MKTNQSQKTRRLATAAVAIGLVASTMVGCSSSGGNGAFLGAGLGAILGNAIGQDTEGTLLGTAIGTAVGYGIGNEIDKNNNDVRYSDRSEYQYQPSNDRYDDQGPYQRIQNDTIEYRYYYEERSRPRPRRRRGCDW